MRRFQLCRYDLLDYEHAWKLQKERVTGILSCNTIGNMLLLLEHPSVYTIGRSGRQQEIIGTTSLQRNIPTTPVVVTDRGGKVTYHGPGQLVAYVVCDLRPHPLTAVRKHVARLEETSIKTLSAYGVAAHRDSKNPGVWVESAKIASLGVKVHRGVAYHGIAINRDPDLRFFEGIIPCGLVNQPITSLANLGLTVSREAFEEQFLIAFREVFDPHWETS